MWTPSVQDLPNEVWVSVLHPAAWSDATVEERGSALQQLENWLAKEETRPPAQISPGVDAVFSESVESSGGILLGHTLDPEILQEPTPIHIRNEALESHEPYEAVSTLFHEDRHLYQQSLGKDPVCALSFHENSVGDQENAKHLIDNCRTEFSRDVPYEPDREAWNGMQDYFHKDIARSTDQMMHGLYCVRLSDDKYQNTCTSLEHARSEDYGYGQ